MTIDEFVQKYQIKMWTSMLSRLNITDFSIWELLNYTNTKVYYGRLSPREDLYVVETLYCKKCHLPLKPKYHKGYFYVTICPCSKTNKTDLTLNKLLSVFSIETAKKVIKRYNEEKTRNFKNRVSYWISKGYNLEEAKLKANEVQCFRNKKSVSVCKGRSDISPGTIEFWTKKGLTKEQAYKQVIETQSRGYSFYVKKYGESKGKMLWEKRQRKWRASFKEAVKKDPTILERKLVKLTSASKESLNLFMPLYEKYNQYFKIYLGIEGSQEYFINYNRKIYFYDFVIPEISLIVEYHGEKFHPNKQKLTETEWMKWRCPFSNTTADEKLIMDQQKINVAIEKGFNVIVVWSSDNIEKERERIERLIIEHIEG